MIGTQEQTNTSTSSFFNKPFKSSAAADLHQKKNIHRLLLLIRCYMAAQHTSVLMPNTKLKLVAHPHPHTHIESAVHASKHRVVHVGRSMARSVWWTISVEHKQIGRHTTLLPSAHTHTFFQWQPLTAPLYSHHGEFCCDIVAADLVVLDAGAGTAGAKETSISSATAAATTASCADKLLPLCLFITPQLTVCTKYGSGF